MSPGSTQAGEGIAGNHRKSRERSAPLSAWEARLFVVVILLAVAISDLGLYFKLDIYQHVNADLTNTIHAQGVEQQLLYAQSERQYRETERQQGEFLKQIKASQDKLDIIGNQGFEIISEIRRVTAAHTKDIEATHTAATRAATAATRAQQNTLKTEKTISQPWWKKLFK